MAHTLHSHFERLSHALFIWTTFHTDANGHSHVHAPVIPGGAEEGGPAAAISGWGDCCGIPIPSAFAAAQQEREKMKGAGNLRFEGSSSIRRIPFD